MSGRPLPEIRERVYILASLPEGGFKSSDWKKQVSALEAAFRRKPLHHLKSMLTDDMCMPRTSPEAPGPTAHKWQHEADYHTKFAALMEGVTAKLPDTIRVRPVPERASQKLSSLSGATSWLKANVDVCQIMLDSMTDRLPSSSASSTTAPETAPVPGLMPLADVSQAAGRGRLCVCGTWSTLTTSTKILNFEADVFYRPILHARMLGWQDDIVKVASKKVSMSELQDMTGNGMSVAALCKVLYPFVRYVQARKA